MAKFEFIQLVALVFLCTVVNYPHRSHAFMCTDMDGELVPCVGYVKGDGTVGSSCCDGIKSLVNLGKTQGLRQQGCQCLMTLLHNASDDEFNRAAQIPNLCKVSIPFAISHNTDCSKVSMD